MQRYSITSLITVLLSEKSKGAIEEKCDKNMYGLIKCVLVKRVRMSIRSLGVKSTSRQSENKGAHINSL